MVANMLHQGVNIDQLEGWLEKVRILFYSFVSLWLLFPPLFHHGKRPWFWNLSFLLPD